MTLGRRIQELRKQKGFSQESLGEWLGVSRQAVSKWEGDNGIPELDTLIAMSKLFGISIGALLGVEEEKGAEPEAQTSRLDEEQVEDILRRYVEQTTPPEETPSSWLAKWGWVPAAAIVIVTVIAVLFVRINSLQSTVRMLQSDVGSLESQVSGSLGSLSDSIRDTIHAVLEEENNPVSSFEYEVVGADVGQGTVLLRLDAVLKTYTRGETEVQYEVNWQQGDSSGQAVSNWISGPDWTGSVTIPMNDCTTVTVRIREAEGLTQEIEIPDPTYSLSSDHFILEAYNLQTPFALTIYGRGFTRETARGEWSYIEICSLYPDYVYPTSAHLMAWVNGEQILSEDLIVEDLEPGVFGGSLEAEYQEVSLTEGDTFEILLEVTDNLGRVQEFREGGAVEDGELQNMPLSAPADK